MDGLQIQMSLLGERQHDVLSPGIFSSDGVSIETEKVNQVTPGVPNDQGSEQVPVQKEQTPDTVSPTEFAKIKSSYIRFQVTLQKLQVWRVTPVLINVHVHYTVGYNVYARLASYC